MPSKKYYQRNRDVYLQNQRDFYEDNKEMIKERARIKYHSLSPEEKEKRNNYAKNWYNNLSEDKKNIKRAYAKKKYHNMNGEELQKFKEYQKNYQKMYCEKKKQELENIKKEQGFQPLNLLVKNLSYTNFLSIISISLVDNT